MRRTWFWIGCSTLGVMLMLPSCSSTDQKTADENALSGQDAPTATSGGGTVTPGSPAPKGPCLKVCLVNGYPWPAPMPPAPADGSADPASANATQPPAPPCPPLDPNDPGAKAPAGCVTPPLPPPSALQCTTFCAPAPGCKLVCDPFGVQPLPAPAPGPQPQPKADDPNAPVAAGAGTVVPFLPLCKWDCPPPPPPPGKKCGPWPGGQCAADEICDVQGCLPGSGGVCVDKLTACPPVATAVYLPVCGCDGKTYASNCDRVLAGVALGHKGECQVPPPPPPPPAQKCGGLAGIACPAGQICDVVGCAADGMGLCVPKPQACPSLFAPVCACDGKTYANNCERQTAGVALGYEGACQSAPPMPPVPCCKTVCPDPSKPCPLVCDPSATCAS